MAYLIKCLFFLTIKLTSCDDSLNDKYEKPNEFFYISGILNVTKVT